MPDNTTNTDNTTKGYIGFTGNHLLLKNIANLDNPESAHRYHTLEETEFKYDLSINKSNNIEIAKVFLDDGFPNGLTINNDLNLRGFIKSFNEQTEPVTINEREQLKFSGANFYKNGRYAGYEYCFKFSVNILFRIKLERIVSNSGSTGNNTSGTQGTTYTGNEKPEFKYNNLAQLEQLFPYQLQNITRDIKGNNFDRADKTGRLVGNIIFLPNYAGTDINIPNNKLYLKYKFFDISETPNYYPKNKILLDYFKNSDFKYCEFNQYFKNQELSGINHFHQNYDKIDNIPSWFGNTDNTERIFYSGRPPKERVINYQDLINEGSGIITDIGYFNKNNTDDLYYFGLLKKSFLILLIRNNNIDTAIFTFDYLSKFSPFNIKRQPITDYDTIRTKRSKLRDLSRWINFRDTPRI